MLTRQKAIATFKVKLRIQIEQMDLMLKDQAQGAPQTQEAQMRMMAKMMVNQSKGNDELFEETGVDDEQLNYVI